MIRALLLLLSLAGLLAAQPRVVLNPLTGRFEWNDKTVGGVPQDVTGTPEDGFVPTYVAGTGRWVWAAPPGSAGGETNTASNVGSAGVGAFDSKSGADLRFRKLNAASSTLSITLDALNQKIDIDFAALTASRLLVTNSSGYPAVSAVTATEAGYLAGVTGALQTQIDGKAATSHNHSGSQITSGTIPVTVGGTGRTSWTASRCVQVASDGLSLEVAGVSCGGGNVSGTITTSGRSVYATGSGTVAEDASFVRVAAGQYTLYDATGPNKLIIQAGSAQSSTNLISILDSAGANLATVNFVGGFTGNSFINTGATVGMGSAAFGIGSGASFRFSSTTVWNGSVDVELKRSSANNLGVTNGSSTTYWTLGAGGILAGTDNTYDIGASGATRPRSLFLGTNATVGGDYIGASTTAMYFGASGTDGSWRIVRSSNNLVIERREAGSWVTKQTIAP